MLTRNMDGQTNGLIALLPPNTLFEGEMGVKLPIIAYI